MGELYFPFSFLFRLLEHSIPLPPRPLPLPPCVLTPTPPPVLRSPCQGADLNQDRVCQWGWYCKPATPWKRKRCHGTSCSIMSPPSSLQTPEWRNAAFYHCVHVHAHRIMYPDCWNVPNFAYILGAASTLVWYSFTMIAMLLCLYWLLNVFF